MERKRENSMLKKILVLGGSFGGLTAALEIKRRLVDGSR